MTAGPADPHSPEGWGDSGSTIRTVEPGTARGPLDRRTILLAAVTLIDQHDLRALTMRRLGAQLGVEGMALYRYIHGREDLLDGIVELVIDDLAGDPEVHLAAEHWPDYLQRLAHGVRRIALAHPQVFPLVATRPPAAPWVRPPLRSLRWMDSFLDTLHRCGFSDAASRAFSSFLLGYLLLVVSGRGADIGPIEQADPPKTDLSEYPRLKSLEAELSQDHSADEFEEALETLLDRIDLLEDHPHPRAAAGTVDDRHTRIPAAPGVRAFAVAKNPPTGDRDPSQADNCCRARRPQNPPPTTNPNRRTERYDMTEGFRSSPPPSPEVPAGAPDPSRYRQEVTETVQRVMGEGIAPPEDSPVDSPQPATTPGQDDSSTADVAKDQAARVADTAKQAGTQVAGTVKDQAGQVTAEAGRQAKQLLSQAQSEVTEQAAATQQRVAEGLHALADELTGMTKNSDQDGPATDLARQAADKAHQAAGWLADRDPGTLLDEVRSFARRKPGTYLAIALGAGIVAGRLTRGLTAPTGDTPAGPSTPDTLAAPSPGLRTGGQRFDGSEPVRSPLGGNPAALGGDLPAVPAPMAGLGAAGVLGDRRGDVAP